MEGLQLLNKIELVFMENNLICINSEQCITTLMKLETNFRI